MLIEPRVKGFICTTAHPEGCKAHVKQQIDYMKQQDITVGPQNVLVIGASSGYGLASRIAAAFSCGAATIGVAFEKAARGSRTATAGWYNCAAFEEFAAAEGLYAKTINGDAFSREIKEQTIELIRRDLGTVDMVVYSLAAPRRTVMSREGDPITYSSVLKTVGQPYTSKSIDLRTNQVTQVTVEPATEVEIDNTVKVMGGEDWQDWIAALRRRGCTGRRSRNGGLFLHRTGADIPDLPKWLHRHGKATSIPDGGHHDEGIQGQRTAGLCLSKQSACHPIQFCDSHCAAVYLNSIQNYEGNGLARRMCTADVSPVP